MGWFTGIPKWYAVNPDGSVKAFDYKPHRMLDIKRWVADVRESPLSGYLPISEKDKDIIINKLGLTWEDEPYYDGEVTTGGEVTLPFFNSNNYEENLYCW